MTVEIELFLMGIKMFAEHLESLCIVAGLAVYTGTYIKVPTHPIIWTVTSTGVITFSAPKFGRGFSHMFSYAAYDMHQFQDLGNWFHFEILNYSFIVQYMSHIIFNIILSILIAFYRFF